MTQRINMTLTTENATLLSQLVPRGRRTEVINTALRTHLLRLQEEQSIRAVTAFLEIHGDIEQEEGKIWDAVDLDTHNT